MPGLPRFARNDTGSSLDSLYLIPDTPPTAILHKINIYILLINLLCINEICFLKNQRLGKLISLKRIIKE